MKQDFETNNFIGSGEYASFEILKSLTGLHLKSLKFFPQLDGIYRQVPISWIISKEEFKQLSEPHQKGSIDIYIKLNQVNIAVRIQGSGHGTKLKGIGKAQHDKVQKNILSKYCQIVDVNKYECSNIFKEKVNNHAINEMIESFKTSKVMMPSILKT